MPRTFISASGWNYDVWSDGLFYPLKLHVSRCGRRMLLLSAEHGPGER